MAQQVSAALRRAYQLHFVMKTTKNARVTMSADNAGNNANVLVHITTITSASHMSSLYAAFITDFDTARI